MPGTLFIVSTPIGNLEDITLRALRVLKEVNLIAAEDTRRTRKLLNHFGIATPALSFHLHNERSRLPALLRRLADGEQIAIVTDAGTPSVSDPGAALVAAARLAGATTVVIPGASAVMAVISLSGLPLVDFTFVGFPPSGSNDRKTWLAGLSAEPRPVVLFEAPHRLARTLADMHELWGDRTVAVGRELTKAHEELVIGPITEVAKRGEWIGELTVLVMPDARSQEIPAEPPNAAQLLAEFRTAADAGLSRRDAVNRLARRYGMSNRAVYAAIEQARKSDGPAS